MTAPGILISDLDTRYQEIEKERSDGQFYMGIARYGKYLLDHEETQKIVAALYEEAKQDLAPYERAWEEFVEEWRELAADLIQIVDVNNITEDSDDFYKNKIPSLRSLLNEERFIASDKDIQHFFNPYQFLIWKIKDLGKESLLIPKHLNESKDFIPLGRRYRKAEEEWNKYELLRQGADWWAHYQIERAAAGILDLSISGNYFKEDSIIDGFYKQEFQEIARNGKITTPIVLHKERFLIWLKRLNNYVLARLREMEKTPVSFEGQKVVSGLSKMSKRDKTRELTTLKKIQSFTQKEKSLLRILSDYEPHETRSLTNQVPTKDIKHLVGDLRKKLRNTGFSLNLVRGNRPFPKNYYQLDFNPSFRKR